MTLKYDYRYRPVDEEAYRALMNSIESTGYTSPVMADKPKKNERSRKNERGNMRRIEPEKRHRLISASSEGDVSIKANRSDVIKIKQKGIDNMSKKQGNVKFFNKAMGWGFIESDDGQSYFVHYSGIVPVNGERRRTLDDGQSVTFDVEQSDRGPIAVNVE